MLNDSKAHLCTSSLVMICYNERYKVPKKGIMTPKKSPNGPKEGVMTPQSGPKAPNLSWTFFRAWHYWMKG